MKRKIGKKWLIPAIAAGVLVILAVVLALVLGGKGEEDTTLAFFTFDGGQEGFRTGAWVADGSVFSVAEEGVEGSGCLKIVSDQPNDARFEKDITLNKGKIYKIEADVRTENIGGDNAFGANLSILSSAESGFTTLKTDAGWTHVVSFVTADKTDSYTLCARLGYYSGDTSGTAWFDNLKVTSVAAADQGYRTVRLTSSQGSSSGSVTEKATYNENTYSDMRTVSWLLLLLFTGAAVIWYLFVEAEDQYYAGKRTELLWKGEKTSFGVTLAILFVTALLLRLVLAGTYYQCSIDVGLFKAWGKTMMNSGFSDFYRDASNCDYPPLYMMILGLMALINKWTGGGSAAYTLWVKVPSIVSDLVIGWLLVRTAEKQGLSRRWIYFLAGVWLFNPMVLLDSACWGQVDSLLTLFVVLTCLFIGKNKYFYAGLCFGLGVMLKPQMIIFLPVFGCAWLCSFIGYLLKKENKKAWISLGGAAGGALLGLAVPYLPFISMGKAQVSILGRQMTLPWIFSLFFGTVDHYSYATVNCYNFWFLLGKNWKPDDAMMGKLSIHTWGMLAIVAISLVTVAVFALQFMRENILIGGGKQGEKKGGKQKNVAAESGELSSFTGNGLVWLTGAYMYAAVSCFGPRMHERYFYPAMALLLFAFLYYRRKHVLVEYALVSGAGFITVHEIMLGLLVGGSIRDAGQSQSRYGDYYWPSLTGYRGFLAALVCVGALVLLAYVVSSRWLPCGEFSKIMNSDGADDGTKKVESGSDDGKNHK